MNTIDGNTHVVLWSPHQRQFHIETLKQMLDTNLRIYFAQNVGDYILLAFAKSSDEAGKIIDTLEAKLKQGPEGQQ